MRSIPISALIHSATLKQYINEDEFGVVTYNDVELSNILIQDTTKIVLTDNNREIELDSVLFYDFKKSTPQNTTFNEEDLIIFNGKQFKIVYIDYMYGFEIHHLEIGLI